MSVCHTPPTRASVVKILNRQCSLRHCQLELSMKFLDSDSLLQMYERNFGIGGKVLVLCE